MKNPINILIVLLSIVCLVIGYCVGALQLYVHSTHHLHFSYIDMPEEIGAATKGDTISYTINRDTLELGFYRG